MKRFSLAMLVLASLVYGLGAAFGADPSPCKAHAVAAAADAAPTATPKCKQNADCANCPHAASKTCPCVAECTCAKDKKDCTCGAGCPCAKADGPCGHECTCREECRCGKKT